MPELDNDIYQKDILYYCKALFIEFDGYGLVRLFHELTGDKN